jgi:hypothetical protein
MKRRRGVAPRSADVMWGELCNVRMVDPEGKPSCPECGDVSVINDRSEPRAWRHLDSCGFTTWLHALKGASPRIRACERVATP